jgi:anti-sigma regulatory factor (Ser/Thr protein kinase)
VKTASFPKTVRATGLRRAGLDETRRWLLLLLLTIAWLLAASVGLLQWNTLAPVDRSLLVTGLLCIAIGWLLSRRTIGLWVLLGGPASLVCAAALSEVTPSASANGAAAAWIALSVSVSHVTYGLVLLTRRWIGLTSILAATALLAALWIERPINVVPGPLAVAGGWIAIAAVAAAALILWMSWHSLRVGADEEDASLAALAQRTEGELERQERSRAWRTAAVRIHERLLSTIRYVLQSDSIDRDGLLRLMNASELAPTPSNDQRLLTVTASSFARRVADVVRLDASVADLPLSESVRQAVRAAASECALNAVQHGEATDVVISARQVDDRAFIEIRDNGTGVDQNAVPGLGWTSVLGDSLRAVGGRWSLRRDTDATVVTLDAPIETGRRRADRREDGFDQGRILMSAPLMTLATVGVAYGWVLNVSGLRAWAFWFVSLIATVVAAVLVGQRRRQPIRMALPVLAAIAMIPWLMGWASPSPDDVSVMASSANAAGYAVIALGIWASGRALTISLFIWALGVLALIPLLQGVSALPIIVTLANGLVAVPVTLFVTRVGTRRFSMAQEAVTAERATIQREVLRASAADAVDQHLASCVGQAERMLHELSTGADFDDAARRRLACLDGLIRATIQVDPLSSGGVAQAASTLVATAFSHSIPVAVGALVSSQDARLLPRPVLSAIESVALTADRLEVRSFTAAGIDYLALRLEGPTVTAFLLDRQWPSTVTINAHEDAEESWTIIVSRPVELT